MFNGTPHFLVCQGKRSHGLFLDARTGMNGGHNLYKPMRIIPYHISIQLAERHKDSYGAAMEAALDVVVVDHLESHWGVGER
jgi:hypothetical protein